MRTGAIIYPILANNASLTALVPAASIFALRAEQPTSTSYIVYREITSIPLNTTGDSTSLTVDPRLRQRSILDINTVQISCFASTYLEVENIAVEVRNALDREWGSVPSPYHNDIYVDSIVYDSAVDDYDDDYGDRGVYMKHLDFTIRVVRVNQGYANQYEMFFDGVDEYLSATDAAVFTPNSSGEDRGFSISVWFRGLPENTGSCGLVEKVSFSPSLTLEYSLYLDSYGKPNLFLWGNNSLLEFLQWTMEVNVINGEWQHIVVTWDLEDTEDSMTAYINGIMYEVDEGNTTFAEGTAWSSITSTDAPLTVGRYFGAVYNECWIDEVAIYDNELNQADANSLYNSGLTSPASEIDYLLAWWRMGDTLGPLTYPTIEDASSNSNPLTMQNMYSGNIGTVVPSPFPNLYALSFDGIDAYLEVPTNAALSPVAGEGFTIMCWVKVPQVGTATVILNKTSVPYNPEYVVQIQPGGKPKIFFYGNLDGSIYQSLELNQELVVDTWYHIAFTFTNFTAGILGYIDGQNVAGTAGSSPTWSASINGTSPLWMARQGVSYYEIELDELAIFTSVLYPNTIEAIYNQGKPLDLTYFDYGFIELNGWWRMGDTIGTATFPIIVDASSNTNDGTMNNMLDSDITDTDVP